MTQHADTITVTATRTETRIGDTPNSIVVITAETLDTTAAATIDDALRQVPGFTLFRRSGSRVANPTAQGLSLRGIGASGASRALVLDDGIPLNDAFGGWVYWGRVPRAAVEQVEVVRGGASDLYGSTAMGGVVQFLRRDDPGLVVDATAGSHETAATSLFAAEAWGGWSGSLAADLWTTGGHVLVRPSQRGAVDTEADSRHAAIDASVRRDRAFLRASHFDEERSNGTPMQVNDTATRQLAAGFDTPVARGTLVLRGYGTRQDYRQTFSAIAANRATERLTVDQQVPSRSVGGSAQWSRVLGRSHAIVSGVEGRSVRGTSDELQFAFSGATSRTASHGRQRTVGAFLEDVISLSPSLAVTAGLRFDGWRNFDARRDATPLDEREDSAWSPRLSVLWRSSDRLSGTLSAYRSFRAPTLNELYRGFRVGNVVTLANESLGPERLTAFEAGLRTRNLRTTFFWMTVDDTIANLTLTTTPALITRQRANLGQSRSRGVEIEGEYRIGTRWRASAGWLLVDGAVTDGPLEGKRLPQVPRNAVTAQILYSARLTASMQARWSSMQFDDDRNELPLRSALVADVFLSHPIRRGLEATLAVENLFDREIEASATPVVTLAQPRAFRVGVRLRR